MVHIVNVGTQKKCGGGGGTGWSVKEEEAKE